MNILFMMDRRVNAGSIQAVARYISAGNQLGHNVAVYGQPDPSFPDIRCSTDIRNFDYLVMVVEFGLRWMTALRMLSVLSEMPRARRVILDTDGMYNPIVSVDGYDRNHPDQEVQKFWRTQCDTLVDKILQPTLEPLDERVISFPFYGFDPALQMDQKNSPAKRYDIMHVGHNWWRWREISTCLLPAIERIRSQLNEICFVGAWWGDVPDGAREANLDVAFGFDADWFKRLRIQVRPPVPYTDVMSTMSQSRINIMTQRPLFRRLRILTSKYFEILCADTIPLPVLEVDLAEEVYGPSGRELALNGRIADKLLAVLSEPMKYREIIRQVRQYAAEHHSYCKRVEGLVGVLQA